MLTSSENNVYGLLFIKTFVCVQTLFVCVNTSGCLQKYMHRTGVLSGMVEDKLKEIRECRIQVAAGGDLPWRSSARNPNFELYLLPRVSCYCVVIELLSSCHRVVIELSSSCYRVSCYCVVIELLSSYHRVIT